MSSLALAVDATLSGAGRAGLVAATDLRAAGRKVVVLQACDRMSGRTESVRLAEADLEAGGPGGRRTWRQADLEAGGQWTRPSQVELAGLARDLGVMAGAAGLTVTAFAAA